MRESILTIPISEILEPKEGCPICRMRDMLEQRTVECVPMDVWMKRVMESFYPDGFPDFVLQYAGIAQQYLFHYIRTNEEI